MLVSGHTAWRDDARAVALLSQFVRLRGRARWEVLIKSFIRALRFDATTYQLPRGGGAVKANSFDPAGESHELHQANAPPVEVNLVTLQTVKRRRGMGVMVVVPSFAKSQQRDPPVVS